jgi:hypothetical protein
MSASAYQTSLRCWKAIRGDFKAWSLNGAVLQPNGTLTLDTASAQVENDPQPFLEGGHSFYNGGSFYVGEALSPEVAAQFSVDELVPSWNAETPTGTWLEVWLRVRLGERWSTWKNLGVWASDNSTIQRHSVADQRDADTSVSTDTLIVHPSGEVTAWQMKVRLFSADGAHLPTLRLAAVAVTSPKPASPILLPGNPKLWNLRYPVPECSQMIYPDGGNVWCSPTSLAMLFGYWGWRESNEIRVRTSVEGVYDWVFEGYGNWSFNAAYAGHRGFEAYVMRVSSLAELEPWLAAGVPVVVSFGWKAGQLTGAPIPSSNGHLAVLAGFDPQGNPIINDPACATDEGVCRTYDRTEWETLFLARSGGTAYLIHPQEWKVP